MKPEWRQLGVTALVTVLVFLLSRGGNPAPGLGLVVVLEAYGFWRRSDWSLDGLALASPRWLVQASAVILIAAAPQLGTQLVLSLLLYAWLVWLQVPASPAGRQRRALIRAAVVQFIAIAAIFTGVAFWRWPAAVAWLASWAVSFLVADNFLATHSERARGVLATAWALIAAEVAWVESVWVVNYILAGGAIIIPQAAIILGVLSYCFGGIYVAHVSARLSRARLIEYLLVGLVLLLIIVVGTKWKAVI